MQEIFGHNEQLTSAFRSTLSEARFSRYLKDGGGDVLAGLKLYHWNAQLSQCLYLMVQTWEVSLRNKLNAFLCWKYNGVWPYDESRAVRGFSNTDKTRLRETIERQQRIRGVERPATDSIVADLSAGFWVSQLTKSYDVPYAWRYNLTRVFPHAPGLSREDASGMCDRILDVRNRIAHHEPIYHLPLGVIRNEMATLISAMCPGADAYASGMCDFAKVWATDPRASTQQQVTGAASSSEAPPPPQTPAA